MIIKDTDKREPKERVLTPCFAARMSPALAKEIAGRLQVTIPTPTDMGAHVLAKGSRLFLREWTGAPTGRADVVRVVEVGPTSLIVERTWGWSQGKIDDDLSFLALAIVPNIFAKVGFE